MEKIILLSGHFNTTLHLKYLDVDVFNFTFYYILSLPSLPTSFYQSKESIAHILSPQLSCGFEIYFHVKKPQQKYYEILYFLYSSDLLMPNHVEICGESLFMFNERKKMSKKGYLQLF